MLVLFDGWASLFRDRVVPWRIGMAEKVMAQLEREALPPFVAGRRWYAAKGETVRRVTLVDQAEWKAPESRWLVSLIRVVPDAGEGQTYFLPLTLAWEDEDEERMRALAWLTVAKVRQQAKVGVLADAFGDETFCRTLVAAIGAREQLKLAARHTAFQAGRTPSRTSRAVHTTSCPWPLRVRRAATRSSRWASACS